MHHKELYHTQQQEHRHLAGMECSDIKPKLQVNEYLQPTRRKPHLDYIVYSYFQADS